MKTSRRFTCCKRIDFSPRNSPAHRLRVPLSLEKVFNVHNTTSLTASPNLVLNAKTQWPKRSPGRIISKAGTFANGDITVPGRRWREIRLPVNRAEPQGQPIPHLCLYLEQRRMDCVRAEAIVIAFSALGNRTQNLMISSLRRARKTDGSGLGRRPMRIAQALRAHYRRRIWSPICARLSRLGDTPFFAQKIG